VMCSVLLFSRSVSIQSTLRDSSTNSAYILIDRNIGSYGALGEVAVYVLPRDPNPALPGAEVRRTASAGDCGW
jgi:hypothetical protein